MVDLIKENWPAELYQRVTTVKAIMEGVGVDKVIVHDVSGGPNKHLAHAPMTALRAKQGKLVPGQLGGNPRRWSYI